MSLNRISRALPSALALLALLAVPAAASADPVASPGASTTVREYQGTIVFSQWDGSDQRWHLAVRRPGAAAERLPVAPSTKPFNADIGPDSAGKPELIYQRCDDGGCDLFVYSLARSTGERPVRNANDPAHDDIQPTIWRGRIAWTRDYGTRTDPRPIVYTKTLTAPRSRPSTRLPGVPQRRCGDVEKTCGPTTNRSVDALELWGDNLAMTVSYACHGCSGIGQTELRLDDVTDRTARQVAFQVVGLSGQSLVGPSFFAGRLAWYRTCLGDPGACQTGGARPWRYRISANTYEQGAAGPVRVDGFADTGSLLYEVTGCSVETGGNFNADCRIDASEAPAYEPAKAPLR